MPSLSELVSAAAREAGGIRALSRATGLSPGYLCRMAKGERMSPSESTLRALCICRATTYAIAVDGKDRLDGA